MSRKAFETEFALNTTIRADDDGKESKYLESTKNLWTTYGTDNTNFLLARYYLVGCRRRADENKCWAGSFDDFEQRDDDPNDGEDLGIEDGEEGEQEEETA